jgi:hypothetical protein
VDINDVSASRAQYEMALRVVSEVLGTALNDHRLTEEELTTWTREVLDTCYSIGATYEEGHVRAVATSMAERLQS